MDKETLSNYGWVVIAVLVLSVMIALATPFGTYVSNAVKSTTEGIFQTEQKAFGAAGIIIGDQSFDNAEQSNTPTLTALPFFTQYDGDKIGCIINGTTTITFDKIQANEYKYDFGNVKTVQFFITEDVGYSLYVGTKNGGQDVCVIKVSGYSDVITINSDTTLSICVYTQGIKPSPVPM